MHSAPDGQGYSRFAQFIASDPELSVYRRFRKLSSRNLLYLQSELIEAEADLAELDAEDNASLDSVDVLYAAKCWEGLVSRAEEFPRERQRLDLIYKIRRLTKEYQEALLLQNEVLRLQQPSKRVQKVFSGWLEEVDPIIGLSRDGLLNNLDDLAALGRGEPDDRLSRLIQYLGGKTMPSLQQGSYPAVKYYSSEWVRRFTGIVSVITAAILLEGAIVALYFVDTAAVKLGLIAVFTCLFACCVGLLSNAGRSELFAGTAAYAAVLVVFVSGNLSTSNGAPNVPS